MEEMLILSDVGVNVATLWRICAEARLENVKTEDLQRLSKNVDI